jgi:hypothetical protein
MSKTILYGGAIITLAATDFTCPKCECPHVENDYWEKMHKSKTGLIYMNCKGCKTRLGITGDMKGDTVVWLKEDEKQ